MSLAYDDYLAEHIGNVNKGLNWMLDNLSLSQEEKSALETAMVSFNHDESKYSTEEYDAYDKYFYGGNKSYKVVQDFNYAWLHHIHHNQHHWQYWVLFEDDPEEERQILNRFLNRQEGTGEYNAAIGKFPIKMLLIPLPYIFEMIADWWSFSWKNGNLFEIFNWYAEHRNKQYIHPNSRKILERILEKIWDVLIMQETADGHDISEIEKQYKRFWAEQKDDLLKWDHPSAQVIGKVVDASETENGLEVTVEHSGIKGQKWGVRRFQNYDGSLTEAGRERYGRPSTPVHYDNKKDPRFKQTVFVSGSSKTQNEDSPYYRKELPKDIRKELDRYVKDGDTILVGDAPGIDRQVQDYLNSKKYDNVEVYGPGKQVRYSANKKWKTNPIDDPDHEEGSTEWLAKKDEAMAERASDGIAIILDEGAKATRKNVGRLADMGKNVSVYQLDKNGLDLDRWYDESELLDIMDTEISKLYDDIKHSDEDLCGIPEVKKYLSYWAEGLAVEHSDTEDDEDLYGVPELKKFPMPDKKHVKSAIRFFNYVDPKYEKELAEAILEKAEEFGLDLKKDITIGDKNMFKKYVTADDSKENNNDRVLTHYGIKGQTWGERRFQYADGSLTPEGRKRYLKESKLDPSSKKDTKKSDPLFDISKLGKGTYKPSETSGAVGGGGGSTSGSEEPEYDSWEKSLYADFEKSGINPANMSDADFKALLIKKGILKEGAADSLVATMKQKAMKNYKIYSKKDDPAKTETTTTTDTSSDKKKQSKKESDGSSESSGRASKASSGSGSKQAQANDISAVKTNEKSSVDSLEKSITSKIEKLSKLKEGAISLGDILSDDMDSFISKLSDLIDDDISGLSYKDLKELRERLQKQYEDSKKDKESDDKSEENKEDKAEDEEKKEK